jgi:hypothetical protein
VTVVGGSKGDELEVVTMAAREAAEQANWTVVPHKLPPERINEVIRCSTDGDSRCIGQLLDDVGADRLIALRLADERYQNQLARVVYGTVSRRGGDVLASNQRHCESCRADLLADHVRSLVTDLVRNARSKVNPATLTVRSIPSRARVRLDGEVVGPTELQIPVDAGVHILEVALKDYQPHSQEITVHDGQRLEVGIKLVPVTGVRRDSDRGDDTVHPAKQQRLAPWLVIGGGVVLAAGGGLLITWDEDEVRQGAVVPEYRDTATTGVILAGTGAIAAVAGAVWLMRAHKKPVRSVIPAVTYQDGARIGLAGRF